jgi:16S rRNA (cytidine1402-2'-O)-methyltransferase
MLTFEAVNKEKGKLYLIPTPIGNLKDITYRTVEVLGQCDYLYAEDTRTTGILLKHYDIKTNLRSFHLHNEHAKVDELIQLIKNDKVIGLVSDAGTPGISDPGFLAARACAEQNLQIEALPGATAFIPALLESGFPCDRFAFEGFLPVKKGRQTKLQELKDEKRTLIFYESPYRVVKTLKDFETVFGENTKASVSRELTKLYHQTLRGTLAELIKHFEINLPKGEFVIIISPIHEKNL